MFQDEAGFGRINKPKYCWCQEGIRPSVPCHHIREYRYAYGAVEPLTGDGYFLVMPYCNTVCMNIFLKKLSERFPDDIILLCCDGAAWHKSGGLELPENIILCPALSRLCGVFPFFLLGRGEIPPCRGLPKLTALTRWFGHHRA